MDLTAKRKQESSSFHHSKKAGEELPRHWQFQSRTEATCNTDSIIVHISSEAFEYDLSQQNCSMPVPSLNSSPGFMLRRRRTKLREILADWCSHFLFLLKNRKRDALFFVVGPVGIGKVLFMTQKLLSTYFLILLPMIMREYSKSHFKWAVLLMHLSLEAYLLVQIFFNFYCCITQKHSGPHHAVAVQEIATATNFELPTTPESIAEHQKHVEERLENAHGESKGNRIPMWLALEPFEWGYCNKSNTPRPPRCHYNHVIRSPVVNFDHYCPWIWNAVGYFNYRYFLTFVFSVFIMMVYKYSLLTEPYNNLYTNEYQQQLRFERLARSEGSDFIRFPGMIPLQSERKAIRQSRRLSMALGCGMLLLGGLHVYLTSTGQTTLEFKSRVMAYCCCRKSHYHRRQVRPYSFHRIADNWKRVFGRNWARSLLIPNTSPPEYMPFPVPGHDGLRPSMMNGSESRNHQLREL